MHVSDKCLSLILTLFFRQMFKLDSDLIFSDKCLSLIPTLFYRQMFKLDPDLMVKYPFYQDEWNKISYNDYKGNFPDQPPNNWFVVFR